MNEHRALVERVMTALVNGDTDALDDVMAEEYIQHNALPDGRDGVKLLSQSLRAAFPDMTVEIHDVISEGDRVVARMSMEGTHSGPFLGVDATGKRVRVDSIDIWRVADGKLVEHWDSVDQLGLMQQLGLA
jgi:steroid delta-isomerase-like uncharacterized protein